jgi:hypothetical protein
LHSLISHLHQPNNFVASESGPASPADGWYMTLFAVICKASYVTSLMFVFVLGWGLGSGANLPLCYFCSSCVLQCWLHDKVLADETHDPLDCE